MFVRDGDVIQVGIYECNHRSTNYFSTSRVSVSQLIFPRRPVCVRRQSGSKYIADASVVGLYTAGELYQREDEALDEDVHFWLGFKQEHDLLRLLGIECDIVEDRRKHASSEFYKLEHDFGCTQALINQVIAAAMIGDSTWESRAFQLVDLILGSVTKLYARDSAREVVTAEMAEEIKRYLITNVHQKLSFHVLADRYSVSPFALYKGFKRKTGSTLHGYLTEARLRLAWHLIEDTPLSITEIAMQTGFSSHSHFSMAFRKRFGVQPSVRRATNSDNLLIADPPPIR